MLTVLLSFWLLLAGGVEPKVEQIAGLKVIHVSGTPREMGKQQGELLRDSIKANVALIDSKNFPTLDAKAQARISAWPASLKEELEGLAEGSGVTRKELERFQVAEYPIPGRSAAAFGSRTLGARLIQVSTFETIRPIRAEMVLIVFHGPSGIRYVSTTFAGYLGTYAGLNDEGISISSLEVGTPMDDSNNGGLSAPFLARLALAESKTLPGVRTVVDKLPRAGNWIMVVGDGKVPAARVIEFGPKNIAEFGAKDTSEREAPYSSLADIVRRSNQFVSKQLAAGVAPAEQSTNWYNEITKLFDQKEVKPGIIDTIHSLRSIAGTTSPAKIIVMNASEPSLWIGSLGSNTGANAAEPAVVGVALKDLFAGKPLESFAKVDTAKKPIDPETERHAKGTIKPVHKNESSIPELYRMTDEAFTYEASPDNVGSGIVRTLIKIPSPVVTPHEENNSVPIELFRPPGEGPFPYVIVTHIAGGDFELSRFVATTLAKGGIACTFIKLPYYGERKPPGIDIKMLQPDVEIASRSMQQAIKDIRRVIDWIEAQPDLDKGKIGICGISLGSITGALATSIEPRLTHACLIIGGASLHDIVWESAEKEAKEFRRIWSANGGTRESLGEQMKSFDPVTYSDRLKSHVVFMINASQDESVPVVSGKALWEAAGRQRIIWYPCGHYTIVRYIMPALQHTVKFFKAWPDRESNVGVEQGG